MNFGSNPNNKLLSIFFVIVLAFALGTLAYVLWSSVSSLLFGGHPPCSIAPYDFNCICPEGKLKVQQAFWEYACVDKPDAPEEVTFPIETWEEAWAYAGSQFGVDDLSCTGQYFIYDGQLSGKIPKQCSKYGYMGRDSEGRIVGHQIMLSCGIVDSTDEQGSVSGGHMVWALYFDPNDGHIYKRWCKEGEAPFPCPPNIQANMKPPQESVCGDSAEGETKEGFCCTYGETHENCPTDCPKDETEGLVCTTEDLSAFAQPMLGFPESKTLQKFKNLCESRNDSSFSGRHIMADGTFMYQCIRTKDDGQRTVIWTVTYDQDYNLLDASYFLPQVLCYDPSYEGELPVLSILKSFFS